MESQTDGWTIRRKDSTINKDGQKDGKIEIKAYKKTVTQKVRLTKIRKLRMIDRQKDGKK